jgi:hypothetical protein
MSDWSYTGGAIISVGGVALDNEPALYIDERTPSFEKRTATVHAPDKLVSGLCVPFNTVLGDGRRGRERFTSRTRWVFPDQRPALKLEHKFRIGSCTIEEAPSGLHCRGALLGTCAHMVEGRHELSVGFASIDPERGPDGVLEHKVVALFEVSLVRRSAYRTVAAIVPAR